MACLMLLVFFEGPIFPTLFAMTLRGMGKHTKLVSTGLTASISGGAVWPSIAWAVQEWNGGNVRYPMRILVVIYAVIFLGFATFSLRPKLRCWVDSSGRPTVQQGDEGTPHVIAGPEGPSVAWQKGPRGSDWPASLAGVEHIEFATGEDIHSSPCGERENTVPPQDALPMYKTG